MLYRWPALRHKTERLVHVQLPAANLGLSAEQRRGGRRQRLRAGLGDDSRYLNTSGDVVNEAAGATSGRFHRLASARRILRAR